MSVTKGARWALITSDCVEAMKRMKAESVDAVVTDPPYGLGASPPMEDVLRAWLAGERYHARGAGFMGEAWDAFVPGPEVWRETLRVLKPGGHLLAFFGTRTFDLGTLAIRLAGFVVRDTLSWNYGQGFPKSLDLGGGRGTALKPAWEPIILARKPLTGTVAANVAQHGTGALNVDGCRVGERWPANVLLDEEAAAAFDAQTGTLKSGSMKAGVYAGRKSAIYSADGGRPLAQDIIGSEGGPSRFYYVPKASRAERDAGCELLPARTGGEATGREDGAAGMNSPRAGAGRTGGARNTHPTVKPVELMRWLVRLVTPPGGLVLDPFTGSGSTGVAALREGARFVGVEQSEEYSEIARCRLTGETT